MSLDQPKLEADLLAMMAELATLDPLMETADKQRKAAALLAAAVDTYVRAAQVVGVTAVTPDGLSIVQNNKGGLQ